ncbi:MAG: sarcosine oxidase subunit gamma family protein [Gordonia sp. (in: high G+C Gram-positive bacteria)]
MDNITSTVEHAISPLANWSERFAALAPAVLLAERPVAAVVVRTNDPAVATTLGLASACRVRRTGDEVAVWLGPDEWLLYRPGRTGHEYLAEVGNRLSGVPDNARAGTYLIDATGQRTRLLLDGPYAETILAHGCAIDVSPGVFGPDHAAQTLLAQAGVLVHRTAGTDTGFTLFVRSSYADYLARWLTDASTEYITRPPSLRVSQHP